MALRLSTLPAAVVSRYLPGAGDVSRSRMVSHAIECSRLSPHISLDGCKPPQNAGRSGLPKMAQPLLSISCTQRTPAGLPFGIPGIGEVMEGAVQQAPQPGRQLSAGSAVVMMEVAG